ncbi:MAG TPA: FG-GAP-like repeat-containing protein [Acidobacteriota bacterium]|nr:FG-GAP-like repeat-containing protein [Acidobacteriota bacterium]
MNLSWQDLLKIPAAFLETGVMMMDTGTRALTAGIEAVFGRNGDSRVEPPVNGPRTMDAALADLANQLVRVGYITPWGTQDLLVGVQDVLRTARRSFGYIDIRNPRILALPIELPVTLGGILADTLMRLMSVYKVAGPKRFPSLLREAIESYSDTAVFVGLKYKDLIDRYEDRLKRDPDDAGTRLKLGQMYIKCGLYDHAARELNLAAQDSSTQARALHELVVAHYRAGRFEKASEAGIRAMNANPGNERVRGWLWLAAQSLGAYPEAVPAEYRMEARTGYATPSVQYENIAPQIGICKTNSGRGSVIFDYNNDGLLDIAITGPHSGCSLYRNNGDGTFTDVSVESGLDQCVNGFAIVAGDYDNDGFQDLFVTRLGFYHGQGSLYHNNGDGTFTDVTEGAGLNTWGPTFTAHWVDYDRDGYLDLFISYNIAELFDRHFPNRLFHNNGDGTFTDVTDKSGLYSNFATIGSSWGDYDNDGWPDLFLSTFMGHPMLFHNNGDGTFTDVSLRAGFTEHLFGFVCSFCDYDNDGWMDIAQFVWSDHEDFIHTLRYGKGPDDAYPMRIYHNNRDGTFTVKDREIGLDGCWGTMSANLADLNNDGHLDIVLGNGSPRMDRLEPPALLQYDGKRFHNATFSSGLPVAGKGHGVNFADLFGDGRLSLIIADGGAYPGDLQTTSVYYPKELPGNYLNVRLVGTTSNRDAIGARVTLMAGESQQVREVTAGTGFGSLPFEQHFGLDTLAKVDSLEIRWPCGLYQRIENPPINDSIRVTEGESGWQSVYKKRPAKHRSIAGQLSGSLRHKNDRQRG